MSVKANLLDDGIGRWVSIAGLPNREVAVTLDRSEITIKAHRGKAMRKMQAGSLADLVRMAARLSLTPAPKG